MDSLPITNASPLDNGHAGTKVCNPFITYKKIDKIISENSDGKTLTMTLPCPIQLGVIQINFSLY